MLNMIRRGKGSLREGRGGSEKKRAYISRRQSLSKIYYKCA